MNYKWVKKPVVIVPEPVGIKIVIYGPSHVDDVTVEAEFLIVGEEIVHVVFVEVLVLWKFKKKIELIY